MHILMDCEIFLKMFDGPESIFPFIASFYYLAKTFENLSGFEQFVQTGHREDLRKIRHVKQEIKSFELHENKW